MVDLQEALGSPDPQACSLKAHHLIGLNASMITRAEPITTQELPVTSRVLVWGDSFAALKAAVDLADLGYPVIQAYPGATLSPLLPGAPPAQPPGAELQDLISRAQSHPGIQLLPQTHLVEVQGSAGNFRVRLQTSQEVREEIVGAMILAPELRLEPGEAAAGARHPTPGSSPCPGWRTCWPPRRRPPSLTRRPPASGWPSWEATATPWPWRRTLSAARRLLSRDNCQVFLFIRDAKVGAPDMEAALEEAQASGLIVFKLPQLPDPVAGR